MDSDFWKKAANIATFSASALTVIGGLTAAGAWAASYFADQKDLMIATCTYGQEGNLVGQQIVVGNVYSRYINAKLNLLESEIEAANNDDPNLKIKIEAAKINLEVLWHEMIMENERADKMVDNFDSEECEEAVGVRMGG